MLSSNREFSLELHKACAEYGTRQDGEWEPNRMRESSSYT